ncbi:MAG TPA: glycoside hydrolase family 18 protein [Puia sp.]|nr:glycoside hydrolase family 18 protein [Puia sp.]
MKKIGDFFKFRKNADARWVARVKRVIDTLGLVAAISAEKDSILRIHKLTSNFTDSERVYYQTLLVLLNNIDKASSSIAAKSRNGPPPGSKPADSTFSPVMDDDMQTLIDKIVDRTPRTEEPDTTMSSKAAWLAALSRIESTRTYSDTIGDTLRRYRIGLKKKLQIYGFHNATSNAKYNGYRFDRISTLVYNSLIIEPNGVIKPRGWDTARVLKDAEAAGVGIVANFMMQNKGNIAAFLGNSKARSDFIQLAVPLLKKYKTTGVNIVFDGLQPGNAGDFVSFIAELRNSKGFGDSLYQIFITLPIADRSHCFDLTSLDKLTDFFIINFSADPEHPPIGSGPVFPLSGGQDNSIRTRLSALTNTGLKQSKLIVGIPYFGAEWKVSGTTGAGRFLQYLAYEDIRSKNAEWKASTDISTGAIVMDSPPLGGKEKDSIYRIWTDDDNTLGKKYGFILDSKLNGIAISTLGYDAGYGELWDELAYKFLEPDTIPLRYALLPLPPRPGFFKKLFEKLYLYNYIVQHPCERCFDNIQDSATSARVYEYLDELNVDSLIIVRQRKDPNYNMPSRFKFINEELTTLTIYISLSLIFITLVTAFFYFYKIKTAGDEWEWKRPIGISLGIMIVLTALFIFTWAFCDKNRGVFAEKKENHYNGITVKVHRDLPIETAHAGSFQTVSSYCDDALIRSKCIDIPLFYFLSILIVSMGIGYCVNLLYHTVINNDDNP